MATDRVAVAVRRKHEPALLREELRIRDARLARITPRDRPHYPAMERLTILELGAVRGLSAAQTAEPVNKFSDLIAHIVRP